MPGFWLSAQLLFVLPNGVLSLCDAMVEGPLLAVFCRSRPLSALVKSDANDWSSRMQMGGQVHAITHLGPPDGDQERSMSRCPKRRLQRAR